jgi:RHS repeat-associated protein
LPTNFKTYQDFNYDDWGNIKFKTGVGNYTYYATKPHQLNEVKSASGAQLYKFFYDANGNSKTDGTRTFTYGSYDKPTLITKAGSSSTMKYGPERELIFKTDTYVENGKNVTYQTTYLGNYEKVYRTGGAGTLTEHKFYIGDIVFTQRSNGSTDTFYLHKDHQGSVIATTNASGAVVSQAIYDPWGKRTAVYLHSTLASFTTSEPTDRGYTGHKHIKDLDIIHMGGRIYDSTLGRFLQADPHIQAPTDSQSYNRYAYVRNNPMSMTDPTGYFFKKLYKALMDISGQTFVHKQIAKVNGLGTGIQVGLNFIPFFGQLASAHFAFDASFVATGSLGAAFKSGVISYAAASLGGMTNGLNGFETFIIRGAVGGIFNVVQGGQFGHGFIAAGVGMLGAQGASALGFSGNVAQVLASAVIGGTASRLTGGKFTNGAASAAFAAVASSIGNSVASTSAGGGKSDAKGATDALAKLKADKKINTMKYFDTADEAAKEILNLVSPISKDFNIEIGGSIIHDRLGYRYTNPQLGDSVSVNLDYGYDGYHTHPNAFFEFSNSHNARSGGTGDVGWLNQPANRGVTLYLGTQIDGKTFIGSCTAATCFHSPYGTEPNKVL